MDIPSADTLEKTEVIKTGTLIDFLSGIGGFPRGKISEVWGDEAVGKSTVCMQTIAQAQKDGLSCLLADVEYSYTTLYGESLGIDNKKLALLRSQFAEDILNTIEEAVKGGKYDLIVLDSIGGLHSKGEAEKEAGEKTIASQAGLVATFCRKIVPLLAMHNVALVVINHSFTDIMTGKLLTSGGKKLSYHKSLSIRLKSTNKYKKVGDNVVSKFITGQVKKNKLAATEGREETVELVFGKGFSNEAKLLQMAIDAGVITKQGNTFYYGEQRLGVGQTKARQFLEETPELMEEIKARL